MMLKKINLNWFKFIIYLLIIFQSINFIHKYSQKTHLFGHKKSNFFLDKHNYDLDNKNGIPLSLYTCQIYFPDIISELSKESKIKDLDRLFSGILIKKNENDTLDSQIEDFSEYFNPKKNKIYLYSYGLITNELIKKIHHKIYFSEAPIFSEDSSVKKKKNFMISTVGRSFSFDGLSNSNSLLDDKNLKETINAKLLEHEKLDSLQISFLINDKLCQYTYFKSSPIMNLFQHKQGVFSLFLHSFLYKLFIYIFFILIALIFISKLTDFRKSEVKIIFFFLIFFLIYIRAIDLSLFGLDLNNQIIKLLIIIKLHLILTLASLTPIPIKFFNKLKFPFLILPIYCYFKEQYFIYLGLIAIVLIIQLLRESKFQRKIRNRWLNLGLSPIYYGTIFVLLSVLIKFSNNYIARTESNLSIVFLFMNSYFIVSMVLPFLMLIMALVKFDFKQYIKIRSIVYFYLILTYSFITLNSLLYRFFRLPVAISLLLSYIFTQYFHKKLKFLHPNNFNKTKVLSQYTKGAFNKLSINELFKYTAKFLSKNLNITKISYESKSEKLGFDFMNSDNYIENLPQNINYFNLDIERINESENALPYPVEPKDLEIRLFYPLKSNSNYEEKTYLCLGPSSKLFWTSEEADFLYEIVRIFNTTKNNIELNKDFRDEQIKAEKEREEKRVQLLFSKKLEEKNTAITDSMNYASKIQQSILPSELDFSDFFKSSFSIYKPRNVVSGDFIWFYKINESDAILALADCTGHSVPGAFLTLISNAILNNIIKERKINSPAEILNQADIMMKDTFKSHEPKNTDGMDIGLIFIKNGAKEIVFSSANINLFVVENGEILQLKGQKKGIGDKRKLIFTEQVISLQRTTKIYLTSDGLCDMAITKVNKKTRFKTKGIMEFLSTNNNLSLKEQKQNLERIITEAIESYPQRDDITVIGVEINNDND